MVSERRRRTKKLIIVFITWMLVGVTVTAAWAAGPAKPVIEAEMPDCYAYIGGDEIILFTNALRHIPRSIAVPFHTQFLRHPIAVPLGLVNDANHRHIFYVHSVPLVSQHIAVGRTGIIAALSVRQL